MTQPSFPEALRVFARIGILSFGGPAAQIAVMHKELVEDRPWLTEKGFMNALSFCMLLPGPEAMQLATYSGWRLHGTLGGIAAGLLFVLPGAFVMLALAAIYFAFGTVPIVEALFLGVKAAVVVIVIQALIKVAGKALQSREHWFIAALAFAAIFFLAAPFPLLVVVAALYGFLTAEPPTGDASPAPKGWSAALSTALVWLAIWLVPLLAIGWASGLMADIGAFFSRLAVVTFGGAYAVLAYMAQDVVANYGWLEPGEMMDGLGLAETTPGPLILVTEFVGFLAAAKEGGFWYGVLGALVALWATFVPCFLWIFVGAPYIDWIGAQPRLSGALAAITASVVGVILNLTIWFALHVFFAEVTQEWVSGLTLWIPTLETFDWRAALLTMAAAVMALGLKWGLARVLGGSALLGLVFSL